MPHKINNGNGGYLREVTRAGKILVLKLFLVINNYFINI